MKKAVFIFLGCAIVVFLTFVLLQKDTPITNYPADGDVIVAFGDSLIEGVGASTGNALPEQIAKMIDKPIINLGVSGDTTAQGLARIDEVLDLNPDMVIISLGGNDLIKRVARADIYSNLEDIVVQLQNAGAIVVLLGVNGPFRNINDEYEALSKQYGTAYIEDILDGMLGKTEFMSDAIHPNDTGYRLIAERVALVVEELMQ